MQQNYLSDEKLPPKKKITYLTLLLWAVREENLSMNVFIYKIWFPF